MTHSTESFESRHSAAGLSVPDEYDQFDARELAKVLYRYELGSVQEIAAFRRGSRRAPKLRIKTNQGEYLLKRRASGRDDPYRVAFAHTLQLHLKHHDYPVAALVGTRKEHNTMVQSGENIYEMFAFVQGARDDGSPASAHESGRALAAFHRISCTLESDYESPVGTYHAAGGLEAKLEEIPAAIGRVETDVDQPLIRSICKTLRRMYREAAEKSEKFGYCEWERIVVHGDWHPGNILYRNGVVVAVLDYDSARREPRISDIANGALQFTMQMEKPTDPVNWPQGFDMNRLRSFLTGYDRHASHPLDEQELAAVPWLIIEALIVESVVPIAATGSFARLRGSEFLRMVERKVTWMKEHAAEVGTRE